VEMTGNAWGTCGDRMEGTHGFLQISESWEFLLGEALSPLSISPPTLPLV
jgi:hypothetical protein